MRTASPRASHDEEEESYFISMSDMMVGLVFIFVIMLVYFALQYRKTTEELAGASQTRTKILQDLERRLKDKGVQVTVDYDTGVLRLPEKVLFAKGQADLSPSGVMAVRTVAGEMAKVLPCYTFNAPRAGCRATPHRIDAIFVEGHTDIDRIAPGSRWKDNIDLSAMRATNVYRDLITASPLLKQLENQPPSEGDPVPILSVSGYGENRPVDKAFTEIAKAKNRRIDLRFLMATPATPESAPLRDVLVKGR